MIITLALSLMIAELEIEGYKENYPDRQPEWYEVRESYYHVIFWN